MKHFTLLLFKANRNNTRILRLFICLIIIMIKLFLLFLFSISLLVNAQDKSLSLQIKESLRALPESLRDEATVFGYNSLGNRIKLKEGDNEMICWADNPKLIDDKGKIYVVCFPKSLEPYMTRLWELKLNGHSNVYETVAKEIKSGKIKIPELSVRYTLRGHSAEGALPLTIIHVPFANSKSTGFSNEIDNFRPWLMWEGTAHAHIMIPGH